MESITDRTINSIDIKDWNDDGEDVDGDTAPPELITDESDIVDEDIAVTSEEEDRVDTKTPPLWNATVPTRKKSHRAMSAEEEAIYIAALKKKLAEFAPTQPDHSVSSSGTSKKKKALSKQARPSKLDSGNSQKDQTALTTTEAASPPEKKRKRPLELEPEPELKPPQPPRPQKRSGRVSFRKTNRLIVPLAVEALITALSNTPESPTTKDVIRVVDAAADLLDDEPNGVTHDAEIRALLAEEIVWKGMAARSEAGVKERMKKFMQRYGLIPMGGVEAREGAVEAVGVLAESE